MEPGDYFGGAEQLQLRNLTPLRKGNISERTLSRLARNLASPARNLVTRKTRAPGEEISEWNVDRNCISYTTVFFIRTASPTFLDGKLSNPFPESEPTFSILALNKLQHKYRWVIITMCLRSKQHLWNTSLAGTPARVIYSVCYSFSNCQLSSFKLERRTNKCPMDFRWQQAHGSATPDSPFLKPTPSHDEHNDRLDSSKCESV